MRLKKVVPVLFALLLFLYAAASAQTQRGFMFLNLETIEEDAFYGDTSLKEVEIPESTKVIESGAFAGCTDLNVFYCYSRDVSVADDAFENTENVRIYCYSGSTIEAYAQAKNMKIGYLDAFEISCNTVNNGCKDLPITWTVTDIWPGEKAESVYTYRVYNDGTLVQETVETGCIEYVYTPASSGNYELEVTMTNAFSETAMKSEKVPVAGALYMGIYEQDNNKNTSDPVEWIVIHATEEKAFLLTKYILKTDSLFNPAWIKYKYCNWNGSLITTQKSSNNWYPSAETMSFKKINGVTMVPKRDGTYISNDELTSQYHARSWCNGTFYNGAFTDEERERILLTRNTNPENPDFPNIEGGPDTYDYVFFLSYEEVVKYLTNISDRKTSNTPVAKSELGSRTSVYWWLRTRGEFWCNMACVYAQGKYDGKVWMSGTDVGHDIVGYRPAMWITVGG